MRTHRAMVITALWFVAAPGIGGVLVPYLLTGWRGADVPWPVRTLGALLILAGAAMLVSTFAEFVTFGRGTPLPVAPPERLIVSGLYRYMRNPMYGGGLALVVGQGLLLGRSVLFAYAAILAAIFAALIYGYEQPSLRRRYGSEYDAYRRAVPALWPRLTAWTPDQGDR